jgi:hypothetical protein
MLIAHVLVQAQMMEEVGSQKVTQVVQQGADNVFFITPIAIGERSGLQRVGTAVHGKAAEVLPALSTP